MIWSFLAKWAIGGGELVGVAVFSVPAQPKALDALPCDRDEAVELGRLPSGPATVLRSTAEDDDAPGLVRAHLADHPLIGGNGPTMHAAAVSVLHSLRKNAADPIGWLRHVRPARAPRRARGRDRQGHPRRRAGRGRRPLPGRVVRGQGDRPPGVAPARRGRHGRRPLAPPDRHDMPQETAP